MPSIKAIFLLFALVAPWSGAAAAELSYADLVQRMSRLERLAAPVPAGEKAGASTSHDRKSRFDPATGAYHDWSANDDGGGFIREEGGGQVMVDLEGPGVLWRIWSAMPEQGHVRIYLDGQETPVIDKPFAAFFDDLEKDYPGIAMTLSRGRNSFVPISFAKSCKVVMAAGWGRYFHATHTLFPEGTVVEPFPGFTPAVVPLLKGASETWRRAGSSPYPAVDVAIKERTLEILPGREERLAVPGAGAVRMLKVKPMGLPADRIAQEDILRELTLSLSWDGEEKPSVWAPLGDFFATSPGLNPFKTLPMGCVDGEFYSYWYMPFAGGMELAIGNGGAAARTIAVTLETVALEAAEAARLLRFCAAWHGDDFTGLDAERFVHRQGDRWPDWPLLVVKGGGRYVGMSLHVWKHGGWWGEGDEKFYVDGEAFPSTLGTGSEDYIGYAWAADPPFVTFECAAAACSVIRPDAQQDTAVCRFHLGDEIPFRSGFEGFLEVMPNADCKPAIYETCVYWYRDGEAVNPYGEVPPARRRHLRPGRGERHVLPSTFRKIPPKPGTQEGEGLRVLRASAGRHWIQEMGDFAGGSWSGDAQLVWTGATLGDEIEVEFAVEHAGRFDLMAAFTKAPDYGVFALAIDGRPLDRHLDFFAGRVGATGALPLGRFDLAAGKHVLKAKAIGTNPQVRAGSSGSHVFGLDFLRPVAVE
ncbi:glycoside hydrolase family 172 protein [Luteolibacter marinus]|uniref:glycoside hydrolase family 172 protein n=1 Tax=Luteolibacter marinus TaxID=2776705 RepID=UPI001865F73D|nr:glycoside hydrolase family 172 protein [Luteolibacter marinus]